MKKSIITAFVFLGLVSSANVMANGQPNSEGKIDKAGRMSVDNRVKRQKTRIEHKLEKGKITQGEADQLNKSVDAVAAKKEEAKADGKLTKDERKGLQKELNANSKAIKAAGKTEEKKE